jgi:hypothetical protein
MKYQADGHKWGRGVNPEYEVVRSDSDGDGLSDQWEEINGRDPQDGLLLFEFDCGGWQTEGWEADGIPSNIAGSLGYLDFPLADRKGTIQRKGLRTSAASRDKALVIRIRTANRVRATVFVNGKQLGDEQVVKRGESFSTLRLPLSNNPAWRGAIESLKLDLRGANGTWIEIDSISVDRGG